jgi:hypothetical protein
MLSTTIFLVILRTTYIVWVELDVLAKRELPLLLWNVVTVGVPKSLSKS